VGSLFPKGKVASKGTNGEAKRGAGGSSTVHNPPAQETNGDLEHEANGVWTKKDDIFL